MHTIIAKKNSPHKRRNYNYEYSDYNIFRLYFHFYTTTVTKRRIFTTHMNNIEILIIIISEESLSPFKLQVPSLVTSHYRTTRAVWALRTTYKKCVVLDHL